MFPSPGRKDSRLATAQITADTLDSADLPCGQPSGTSLRLRMAKLHKLTVPQVSSRQSTVRRQSTKARAGLPNGRKHHYPFVFLAPERSPSFSNIAFAKRSISSCVVL